jgi:hypothetical protein
MTAIKQLAPSTDDLLDEEALIKEARVLSRRRRRRRGLLVITLLAAACLIVVGVDRFSSETTSHGHNDVSATSAVTCQSARVKLLGVTDVSGAAVYGGALVRASVTSTVACSMSGYPIVAAQLTSQSTATASDVRDTYLGGGIRTTAPLPRLSITSLPRVVSFTIQFVVGDGPVCPQINTIKITLPGSREILRARPIFEAGGLALPMRYIYCGELQVTPMVSGSSGKS